MNHIPLAKPFLGEEEVKAAADVVRSGWLVQGPKVKELERMMEERFSAYAVAVNSCSTALILALEAAGSSHLDIGVPSYTFVATVNGVLHTGGNPIFLEIDESLNIDPALSPSFLDALIAVHQVGLPLDLRAFRSFYVIEDAACAFGAKIDGREIGFEGGQDEDVLATCFSFHASKSIVAGEGGLLVTRRKDVAERVRRLRDHGTSIPADERTKDGRYIEEEYTELGCNGRMTDIAAAIVIEQIKKSSDILGLRRDLALRYSKHLGERFLVPKEPAGVVHAYQRYIVLCRDGVERNYLFEKLTTASISCRKGLQQCHKQPYIAERRFTGFDIPVPSLPRTEAIAARALQIPLFSGMTYEEQDRVIEVLLND